jgi:putative nucleotidyltransferase with HDIG domain
MRRTRKADGPKAARLFVPARNRSLRSWVRSAAVQKGAIGAATILALSAILSFQSLSPRLDLREGEVSPRDIESPRTVEFIDWDRTMVRRQEAAASVQPVYRLVPEETEEAKQAVSRTFAAIRRVKEEVPNPTRREGLERLRAALGTLLPEAMGEQAYLLSPEELERAEILASDAVRQVMADGVREGKLEEARRRANALISASGQPGRVVTVATAVASQALRPNLLLDGEETRRRQRLAMEAVPPVVVRILRGEVIVRRGEVVTRDHLQKLAAVGLAQPLRGLRPVAGMTLASALLVALASFSLVRHQEEVWRQNKLLVLTSLITLTTVLAARLVIARFQPYLMPAAAATMLLAILLNPGLAVLVGTVVAFAVGFLSGWDLRLGFVTLVGAVAGAYAIRHLYRRIDLAYAGLKVGVANMLAIAAVELVGHAALYPEVLSKAAYGMANGLLSGLIAIGLLPYLESLFGLLTPIKLLELANPGHPLLRRLQLEAPGTYHHSIMVGNLAEAAAEAIGANGLLVRVGTYYHDIGKLRRPAFFIENQIGVENPHDRLSPSLSALTVSAHVRDGLQYAREHRLPERIVAFISEHHGTSLISYFYHRAKEREEGTVEEEGYRYEGPKPQSKETAVVMLADAVEASVRALSRPTPERIEQVVRRIVKEKLEDGQLDECDLTLRELEQIVQAFIRVLTGMYHPRIEYPEEREVRASPEKRA